MFYSIVNHFIAGQVLYYAIPGFCFEYIAKFFIFPLFTYLLFQALSDLLHSDTEVIAQQAGANGSQTYRPPCKGKYDLTSISTRIDTSLEDLIDDGLLPDTPPLSNLSQELSFAFQQTSSQQSDNRSCSTIKVQDKSRPMAPSEAATEDYTILSSQSSSMNHYDIDPAPLFCSTPLRRPELSEKTSIELHINKAKETSRAYQILLKQKNLSHHPDSWTLFRISYSFWRDTGHEKIPAHHLSTLLKSDSDSEPIDDFLLLSKSNSSILIDEAIQRSFPIQWSDSRYFVDFTAMIEVISSKSSSQNHSLRRRASTLLS